MSKLQRLTPKRIEGLKGAVIKELFTEKIPKEMDNVREGFTAVLAIELEDGRSLLLCPRETEDLPVTEVVINPKKRRR
jgi:hypothetical protein